MKRKNLNRNLCFSDLVIEGDITEDTYFELIHTSLNTDPRYGDFRFTKEDLETMAKNFNDGVRGVEIAVDINHDDGKKAYAWIKPGSMKVEESKKLAGQYSLYAQLYRYTSEGEKYIKEGAYRYFSLEIKPKLITTINNVKKVFRNVIVGLALTNSPVIKELSPTYAEQHTTNYSDHMEMFQVFLDALTSQEAVSGSQKETLKAMAALLSDEEQATAKEAIDAVLAKPEDMAEKTAEKKEDPTKNSEESEDKAGESDESAKGEEKKEEAKEGEGAEAEAKDGEGKELSETKKLSEQVAILMSERDKLLSEKREKEIADKALTFAVSKKRGVGFREAKVKDVEAFLKTLSEEQIDQFDKLVSEVVSVDFAERGNSGSQNSSNPDVDALARDIASKEGISQSAALEKAYREKGQWKDTN